MAQTLINNLSYSTLDATKLSGNLPSISGASLTGITTGKVLQAISTSASSRTTTTSSSEETAATSNSITPSATSSKILIVAHGFVGNSRSGVHTQTACLLMLLIQ